MREPTKKGVVEGTKKKKVWLKEPNKKKVWLKEPPLPHPKKKRSGEGPSKKKFGEGVK